MSSTNTSHQAPKKELKTPSSVTDTRLLFGKGKPKVPSASQPHSLTGKETSSASCSNCVQFEELLKNQSKIQMKAKHLEQTNIELRTQVAQLQKQLKNSQDAHYRLGRTLLQKYNLSMFCELCSNEEVLYEYRLVYQPVFVPQDGLQGLVLTIQPSYQVVPTILKKEMTTMLPVVSPTASNNTAGKTSAVVKLKATIGQQEEKIRHLTKELVRLQEQRRHEVSPSTDQQEINVGEQDVNNNEEL